MATHPSDETLLFSGLVFIGRETKELNSRASAMRASGQLSKKQDVDITRINDEIMAALTRADAVAPDEVDKRALLRKLNENVTALRGILESV